MNLSIEVLQPMADPNAPSPEDKSYLSIGSYVSIIDAVSGQPANFSLQVVGGRLQVTPYQEPIDARCE
jgi:hypothetical protein